MASDPGLQPMTDRQKEQRAKFERLAPARVQAVTNALRILANCGDRSSYRYDDSDVEAMFGHIEAAVAKARERFQPRKLEDEFPLFALPTGDAE